MILTVLAFCALLAAIWWLTGGRRARLRPAPADDRQQADRVLALAPNAQAQADVLLSMLVRMGLDPAEACEAMRAQGLVVDAAPEAPQARPYLGVVRRQAELEQLLADALLVGIQAARMDDDYARVGDEYLDPETLIQRIEAAEVSLFGDDRRERYALFGRAVLVLQDMLQAESDGDRRDRIADLLAVFDAHLEALQQEMNAAMARAPDVNAVLWGDSRDRRFYYFKMGVTNTLRRTGILKSLGHLYKLQGVNYNVEEAFQLAAEECPALALAAHMGIEHLVRLSPTEVLGWVQRALPDSRE